MPTDLPEGTEITCPLCREETTTVERNKQDRPYFYCAEYEAAVNMNAPVAHTESFLGQFVVEGRSDESEQRGDENARPSDETDITTRGG